MTYRVCYDSLDDTGAMGYSIFGPTDWPILDMIALLLKNKTQLPGLYASEKTRVTYHFCLASVLVRSI